MERRAFMIGAGAGTLGAVIPFKASSLTTTQPSVVIVGGGMAGATLAKYLRLWSNRAINVWLVAPTAEYVSNIMSNLVLTGQLDYSRLLFGYEKLRNYGVNIVTGVATSVTFEIVANKKVITVAGSTTASATSQSTPFSITCDRAVLAPGIEMEAVLDPDGKVNTEILHAWQAGQQTLDLQNLLRNMPPGQNFVMSIPKSPYRCPPGPYERACVVADYLRRNKPSSKIYVLDANSKIVAEPENFGNAFRGYSDVLTHSLNTNVTAVTMSGKAGSNQLVYYTVNGSAATDPLQGHVANIIPSHKAPKLLFDCGLTGDNKFAPVDVRTFESTVPGMDKFHVLGDASDTSLPKAGHVGNQGAKICAAAIINLFAGKAVEPNPTANSACFSPINSTQASWLSAVYQYYDSPNLSAGKKMVIWNGVGPIGGSQTATEASAPTVDNFGKMQKWYQVLMTDTFA